MHGVVGVVVVEVGLACELENEAVGHGFVEGLPGFVFTLGDISKTIRRCGSEDRIGKC